MAEYIEREALLAEYDRQHAGEPGRARKLIEDAPAADVAPVVHGLWSHLGGDEWCCTNCGEVIHTEGSWEKPDEKFCYECGAKMDKET